MHAGMRALAAPLLLVLLAGCATSSPGTRPRQAVEEQSLERARLLVEWFVALIPEVAYSSVFIEEYPEGTLFTREELETLSPDLPPDMQRKLRQAFDEEDKYEKQQRDYERPRGLGKPLPRNRPRPRRYYNVRPEWFLHKDIIDIVGLPHESTRLGPTVGDLTRFLWLRTEDRMSIPGAMRSLIEESFDELRRTSSAGGRPVMGWSLNVDDRPTSELATLFWAEAFPDAAGEHRGTIYLSPFLVRAVFLHTMKGKGEALVEAHLYTPESLTGNVRTSPDTTTALWEKFARSLRFIMAHELAHASLGLTECEELCDCAAAAQLHKLDGTVDLGAFADVFVQAFKEGSGALWHVAGGNLEADLYRRLAAIEKQIAAGGLDCQDLPPACVRALEGITP